MKQSVFKKLFILSAFFWNYLLLPVQAATVPQEQDADELMDLDIESLMDIEVYSASKISC